MSTARLKTSKKNPSCCVGILTIPHTGKNKYGKSHIMKAYVDWFEDRGVHVVPIPYDTNEHETLFRMINGLLIPGGDTLYIMRNNTFLNTVMRFFELSLHHDEYFPIWGTCFGFEVLLSVVGGFTRFKRYNAHGLTPICLTKDALDSRLFGSFSKKYIHYLEHTDSTAQNHEYGISPQDFMDNLHLKRFYTILATAFDEDKKEYVAAVEGKYYPVYGVIWHPERQQKGGGNFADFFISELKKNDHRCKAVTPSIPSVMNAYKCIQYPEHADQLCYFF